MFTNYKEEDIFIVNLDSEEIHRASNVSGSCNLDRMGSENHFVQPVKDKDDYRLALARLEKKYGKCGHCFRKP